MSSALLVAAFHTWLVSGQSHVQWHDEYLQKGHILPHTHIITYKTTQTFYEKQAEPKAGLG